MMAITAKVKSLAAFALCAAGAAMTAFAARGEELPDGEIFMNPPDSARPWVYWYFMDGNTTREGMKADLDAMKAAGIGGVLILEIGAGRPPRGPVEFLGPKWLELFGYAIAEADRLGIEVALGTGPGWCGAGGKSVTPDDAMQHTVASETTVTGPLDYSSVLPVPAPRAPFFGVRTLEPGLKKKWKSYYHDVAVLAFPEPDGAERLPDADEKALYQRAPFSSRPGVKPYLAPSRKAVPQEKCVAPAKVIDLTAKMDASGRLVWRVPEGRWTIMRVGLRLTGQTTRPAPKPGLGFETGKFERGAIERHLENYADKLLAAAGPRRPGRGLTTLHFDSWEMSAQNGSAGFFGEFERRRGYSPLPYIPAINGRIVGSTEITERFLFDWRNTAQELVIENHLLPIKEYAHGKGLAMSSEPYDMNPCCDIASGAVADVPMCEFWSKGMGFNTEYSCLEAVSIAHTMGRPVVGAEAFTANAEYWKQYPGSMKAQGDWALAFGINCFKFHTYQHQPSLTDKPGMTMCGFYGVNWHRNQTWWPMVDSYHRYLARCQWLLRLGRPVADVLYLLPEGAPMVFQPPKDALMEGDFPDRKGYSFDGCSPDIFMSRARFADKKIDFAGGATYSVLVLPKVDAMTPALMKRILECAEAGVKIIGEVPRKSPSLSGYPKCDEEVAGLAEHIAKARTRADAGGAEPAAGRGTLYPPFASAAKLLADAGLSPDFETTGDLRYIHRRLDGQDIYFVGNRLDKPQTATCRFRAGGVKSVEWWNPLNGERNVLSDWKCAGGAVEVALELGPGESGFVVLWKAAPGMTQGRQAYGGKKGGRVVEGPWKVSFDPAWGGPEGEVELKTLEDWTKRPEWGIRHYSGIATYRKTVTCGKAPASIGLGEVANLARVKLNGRDLGSVWCWPWRVAVPEGVWNDGENLLEIEVANLWANRLVGDASLPPEKRLTRTTVNPYKPTDALGKSGLFGPVTLEFRR